MPSGSVRGGFVCRKELGTASKLESVRVTGLQEGEAHADTLSFSVQLQGCHRKARGMCESTDFSPLRAHIIIKYAMILAQS